MLTDNYKDYTTELIEEAYAIFNGTAVSEVIDMADRQSAVDFLHDNYSNPKTEAIERYLGMVKRLEQVVDAG